MSSIRFEFSCCVDNLLSGLREIDPLLHFDWKNWKQTKMLLLLFRKKYFAGWSYFYFTEGVTCVGNIFLWNVVAFFFFSCVFFLPFLWKWCGNEWLIETSTKTKITLGTRNQKRASIKLIQKFGEMFKFRYAFSYFWRFYVTTSNYVLLLTLRSSMARILWLFFLHDDRGNHLQLFDHYKY